MLQKTTTSVRPHRVAGLTAIVIDDSDVKHGGLEIAQNESITLTSDMLAHHPTVNF